VALVFVKDSVSTFANGAKIRLSKDEAWEDSDPVVKGSPELFTDRPEHVQSSVERAVGPVESASAAPGEKRSAKKKVAASKTAAARADLDG